MTIVADTGPLIALAKVDQLILLQMLFQDVAIPPTVMQESLAKQSPESQRIRQALVTYISSIPLTVLPPDVKLATRSLDLGESEAVALAAMQGVPLLIDDAAGRRAALKVGVHVIGTVGVLLRAKQVGYVEHISPILADLREQGYWLSDTLLQQARRLANE